MLSMSVRCFEEENEAEDGPLEVGAPLLPVLPAPEAPPPSTVFDVDE